MPDRRPVRVCHIMSADLWAGAEVQVATVASYLVERPDVRLTAVLLNDGPLACELRRLAIPVTIIDERRHSAIDILIRLAGYLRSHPIDIVHTHRYKDTVLGVCAARLTGVPAAMRTVHGWSEALDGWDGVKFQAYDVLDKLTLRCFADRIIAVSRQVAARLTESGCNPETVVPLHNGIALPRVRPTRTRRETRRMLGIAEDAPLIGTAGRLSPVKGHAHLLRAARLIVEQVPEARFLIVGDGPLRAALIDTAKRLGIDRACLFLGNRTDVYDLVAAMDVFTLSSLDEGIPMALLEAMALGTPAVATAVGGVPEVLGHRQTGVLVPPADHDALAQAVLEVLANPAWAQALAARAHDLVQCEFSHETQGEAVLAIYRAVARSPRHERSPAALLGGSRSAAPCRDEGAGGTV